MTKVLTLDDVNGFNLTKWPRLIVSGKTVSREQATEIVLRTCDMYFSTNDEIFERQVYQVLGLYYGYDDWAERDRTMREFRRSIRHICLGYLANSRIVSSWVGGPHGWCDWNGNIFTNDYNIGKYPSVAQVYKDWVAIAKAFPFLDLTCQLIINEAGDTQEPIIEIRVVDGKATFVEPGKLVAPVGEPDFMAMERGCTVTMLENAFNFVRDKVADLPWDEDEVDA